MQVTKKGTDAEELGRDPPPQSSRCVAIAGAGISVGEVHVSDSLVTEAASSWIQPAHGDTC